MIRICGTINHDCLEDEREGNMKMKHKKTRLGCRGFTMVELIVVVAILAILLAFAVPHMTGYIKAAHYTTAHAEAKLAADAVQRYLTDEHEKGTAKPYITLWAWRWTVPTARLRIILPEARKAQSSGLLGQMPAKGV
mgnify:CR=1 FL=1